MAKFFRSIHIRIIMWALLPSLCIMGGITLLSLITIKNTALDVVTKRDVVLAKFAAKRLSENLQKYPNFLKTLADKHEFKEKNSKGMTSVLMESSNWLYVFDGGVVFFEVTGEPYWSYPAQTFYQLGYFPDPEGFEQLKQLLRPTFSNILISTDQKHEFIIIAVPVIGEDNQLVGVLSGICSVHRSTIGTTYSKVLEYESGRSSYAFLVDGKANVLYHRRSSLIGSKIENQDAVLSVTQGLVGAKMTDNITGEKVISGFAPVPGTDWGIVTQSDWSTMKNLINFYTRLFLIILWSGGLLSAFIVFYFIQRLLVPVKDLTRGAEQVAEGNYPTIPVKKTNDEIEVLTRRFNQMAQTIEAAFAAREQRIDELDKARMALSRSEERIKGIINAVNDILLMVDASGSILWLNNKGKDVFGEDVEDRKYSEILYREQSIPEDCFIQRYIENESDSDTELQIWVEGKYQHYWCSANGVHWDEAGKVNRVVVVCRNLTEKKQLREEVLRNAQLAALGELAAGVAHEINNPINGIINYAQIVQDRWPQENNPHSKVPEKIIKEGERIAMIVSKLLKFARLDAEKKQAVVLAEVINDALDLIGAMLRKEFITVDVNIAHGLPHCRAVVHQLLQIFLNIIGNARYSLNLKYPGEHPEKRISITCSVVLSDGEEMVRTVFKDYGTGIAKDILDKVCNPFFSTKPPDEGTGLGLSISYGIIEEHEGVLEVKSSHGQWTEVRIDLPIWKPE